MTKNLFYRSWYVVATIVVIIPMFTITARAEQQSPLKRILTAVPSGSPLTKFINATAMVTETQVPFKGGSSGVTMPVGFENPCVSVDLGGHPCVVVQQNGEGEATHLGRFTISQNVFIDIVADVAFGFTTFTAANGDMLFATGTGQGIGPTQAVGNSMIVGGTGRFQSATGRYTTLITFSEPPEGLPSVSYTEVFKGTISSTGSGQ